MNILHKRKEPFSQGISYKSAIICHICSKKITNIFINQTNIITYTNYLGSTLPSFWHVSNTSLKGNNRITYYISRQNYLGSRFLCIWNILCHFTDTKHYNDMFFLCFDESLEFRVCNHMTYEYHHLVDVLDLVNIGLWLDISIFIIFVSASSSSWTECKWY